MGNILAEGKPAVDLVPITPNDSTDIAPCQGLLIAIGGDIKITTIAGNDRTLTVPAGHVIVQCTRVWSTGTTATGISAYY